VKLAHWLAAVGKAVMDSAAVQEVKALQSPLDHGPRPPHAPPGPPHPGRPVVRGDLPLVALKVASGEAVTDSPALAQSCATAWYVLSRSLSEQSALAMHWLEDSMVSALQ
jgi:hypothetical protein